MSRINVFWFRRDLRLNDNAGLYHALKGEYPLLPVFIFDRHILDKLEDNTDPRVNFLYQTLQELKTTLQSLGSDMLIKYGTPEEVWPSILSEYEVNAV